MTVWCWKQEEKDEGETEVQAGRQTSRQTSKKTSRQEGGKEGRKEGEVMEGRHKTGKYEEEVTCTVPSLLPLRPSLLPSPPFIPSASIHRQLPPASLSCTLSHFLSLSLSLSVLAGISLPFSAWCCLSCLHPFRHQCCKERERERERERVNI